MLRTYRPLVSRTPLVSKTRLERGAPLKKVGKRGKRLAKDDRRAAKECKERAQGLCEVTGEIGREAHHMIGRDDMEFRHEVRAMVYLSKERHDDVNKPGGRQRIWAWFRAHRPNDYQLIAHRDKWTGTG